MGGRQLEEEDGAEENKNQPPEGYVCILEQEKKKRKEYEELIKTLRTYETNLLEEWQNHIQEIRMSLQSTVLVENKNKRLFVNFDTRISQLCKEVKLLQTLHISDNKIPESAKSITLHEVNLSKYRD